MSIFKNANESAYVGGKKHWADVIKNSGPGELLIWRQPEEDFNNNSVLIVMPGETAIFIKNGVVETVSENGRYQLSTDNHPFISRIRNAFMGGISSFSCVVYFVRAADSEEILWGTDSPIQVRDKVHNVRTEVKARGAYKVRVTEPVTFLQKLTGNNVPCQTQQDLTRYFQSEFSGKIKATVSRFLNELDQELIGIDAYLEEISDRIQPKIDDALSAYGLQCVTFSLMGLDVDVSKYDRIDEINMRNYETVSAGQAEALGQKAGVDILGSDYGRVKSYEVLKDLVNNPAAAGPAVTGAGIGMGVGMGAMGANIASQLAQQLAGPAQAPAGQTPPPAFQQGSSRFTQQTAQPSVQSVPQQPEAQTQEDPVAALTKARQLLDLGLITQEDFDAKKAEILSRM